MKIVKGLEKFIDFVAIVDALVIVFMAVMICVDIILRIFGHGVKGAVELTVYLVPIIAFLGAGYTMIKGQHIRMELFHSDVCDRIMNTICLIFLAIIGWYCWKAAFATMEANQLSALLKIPKWPIVASTGFGMWLVTLALILNEIKAWVALHQKRAGKNPAPPAEADAD